MPLNNKPYPIASSYHFCRTLRRRHQVRSMTCEKPASIVDWSVSNLIQDIQVDSVISFPQCSDHDSLEANWSMRV